MSDLIIYDLIVILASGFVAGLICRRIGVSMLVGYLVVGALIGPGVLGWINDEHHEIEHFAEAGVLLLLFSIGLEFSLDELSRLRRHILIGGSLQMVIVAVPVAVATGLSGLYGADWRAAAILGCAVAMSSTVLVYKTLAEFGQTASPAGRRAVSILLFQDVAVVPILLLIPLLVGGENSTTLREWLVLLIASPLLVVGVVYAQKAVSRWVVPLLAALRSPELIVLFAIVTLSVVTLGVHAIGLPTPLGALAAGLILSGSRLTGQIDALILSFREAFAGIFFVSLGLLFSPDALLGNPVFVAAGFVILLTVKFIAAALAARTTGLTWRAAAGVGIGLSQIGEFAFVLAFTGVQAGVLPESVYDYVLIFALGSLILTPQMLRIGLKGFGPNVEPESEHAPLWRATPARSAVVIGLGPVGRSLTRRLEQRNIHVCAIDLSPVNLHALAQRGSHTVAGDARDPAILKRACAQEADLVIVSVPADDIALQIVTALRTLNPSGTLLVRCRFVASAAELNKAGADAVVSEEA